MNKRKLLKKLLCGSKNIRFSGVTALAESFGFRLERIAGSHHIFLHPDLPELINFQNVKGKAKPYQVKQLLKIVEKYNLHMEDELMRDYHINIFYSEEDEGYIADIPDLHHCSAFGETAEEALSEVLKAKDAWLRSARAGGKPVPQPHYRPVIYQVA